MAMLPKTIYQYSKDKKLIQVWISSHECKRGGYDRRNIIKCCKGQRLTHRGFVWSYKRTAKLKKNDKQIYLF